jgi:membrane protein YqaA with SNARE-associated domain
MLKGLQHLGMSASTASELLTVNLQKLLGGGLSIIVAGHDVYACFSDTIPHTFLATGYHLGIGALNLMFGCYPPNPFILLSGAAEIGVGMITGIRTLIDTMTPVSQSILDSVAVGFPIWAETVTLSALFGACVGYWSGKSIDNITKGLGITVISSATTASISGLLAGNFVAPFLGGAAGFVTGLLLRKIFMSGSLEEQQRITEKFQHTDYFGESQYFNNYSRYFDNYSQYFGNASQVVPIMQLPPEPIGTLKDGELLLDSLAIAKRFEEDKS